MRNLPESNNYYFDIYKLFTNINWLWAEVLLWTFISSNSTICFSLSLLIHTVTQTYKTETHANSKLYDNRLTLLIFVLVFRLEHPRYHNYISSLCSTSLTSHVNHTSWQPVIYIYLFSNDGILMHEWIL